MHRPHHPSLHEMLALEWEALQEGDCLSKRSNQLKNE